MQTVSLTFPITMTLLPWARVQPLDRLVQTFVGSEIAAMLLFRKGVWVDRRRVLDTSRLVGPRSEITLHAPPGGQYAELTLGPGDIVYEDSWLLVVNKQAGWYSKATPWDVHGNLEAALERFLRARDGGKPTIHLAQQLDYGTSGLMLCTKDPSVNAPLQEAFASRAIDKRYLALCVGCVATEQWELRTGHGRMRSGRWGLYPLEQVGAMLPNGKQVRQAHTSFEVARHMDDATLVWSIPHTGRTHQIRLHLASIGHPLVGDVRYGGPAYFRGYAVEGPTLHAARLRLAHPATGRPLEIEEAMPPHMALLL